MAVRSAEEFRNRILDELGFRVAQEMPHYRRYVNNRKDEYRFYEKRRCYEFGIADYTIPHPFHFSFSNPDRLIRFGIVYTGTTTFQLDNQDISSFSPSSFFVIEDHLRGKQAWKKGQHFHGIEITIYADYFDEIFLKLTGKTITESQLKENLTYHYLPLRLIQCIQQMRALSDTNELNPVYLESKILECMGVIYNELFLKNGEAFANQVPYEDVRVGDRVLHLSSSDLVSIHQAHEILSQEIKNPPTIAALSRTVLLNEQKLKAGFQHVYHMSIGEYTTSIRMSAAAILLCTTNEHIHDIANQVGYAHATNFIKMFRQQYEKTPLQYRNENRQEKDL